MSETPLRRIRKSGELTLQEVAAAVGIDVSALSRIETGNQQPGLALAEKISRYYQGAITEMEILYPERFTATTKQRPARKRASTRMSA